MDLTKIRGLAARVRDLTVLTKIKGLPAKVKGWLSQVNIYLPKVKGFIDSVEPKKRRMVVYIGVPILAAGAWFWFDAKDVGEVNGRGISRSEFEAYLKHKRIPVDQEQRAAAELDRYLEREALAQLIEQEDVLDEEQIEVEVNEFRKQMLISRYFEEFLRQKVTQEAVRNFYASNQERYQSKKVHVAHVLLRTNAKMSDAERQALLTKAQEVHSRALAGNDFAKLVRTYSEDTLSAKRDGDLGWLEEGAIDPAFSGRVFKMSQGEISPPFATPFGFHVVKVIESPQVIQQPFERVQGDIRYELRQRTKEEEMKRLLDDVEIENYLK